MSSSKERKKLSPKAQQIVDIVVTSIEALVVVVCIVVSVMVWVGVSDPADRAFNWFAIQTDSMMGTNADSLNPGDLMFAKRVSSINDLQVGDVIAFKTTLHASDGKEYDDQVLTHRIIEIDYATGSITTKGDNASGPDQKKKTVEDVIGKYAGKWKGVGKVTLWLGGYRKVITNEQKYNDPEMLGGYGYEQGGKTTGFLIIIIPLALLFVYNGYVVAKWILDERAKKIRAAALAEAESNAGANAENEAAIKRAALVEFMRAQGMTDEQIDAYFAQQAATQPAQEPEADASSDVGASTQDGADGDGIADKPE